MFSFGLSPAAGEPGSSVQMAAAAAFAAFADTFAAVAAASDFLKGVCCCCSIGCGVLRLGAGCRAVAC